MGFEMQLQCNECKANTPSMRMWCDNQPNVLGRWIYEHAHCANEYDDAASGFTRYNENHFLDDGMQDWFLPMSATKIGWME